MTNLILNDDLIITPLQEVERDRVEQEIEETIFNTKKSDYDETPLLLGERVGLIDTINTKHDKLEYLITKMRALDWDEYEIPLDSCNAEFKRASKSIYDMAFYNLAYQWEGDSNAAKNLMPIVSSFVTDSSLLTMYGEITKNEFVHARGYAETAKFSFDDPNEAIKKIHAIKDLGKRMHTVSRVFYLAKRAAHLYELGMIKNDKKLYRIAMLFFCALYLMERGQFSSSFGVTFCMGDEGDFIPIAQLVQKIAQDEIEVHAEVGKYVLDVELQTPRGMQFWYDNSSIVKAMITEVLEAELYNVEFLHKEDRKLKNATEHQLKEWVYWNFAPIYDFFRIRTNISFPKTHPLPFLNNWFNTNNQQNSPQEQKNIQYLLGRVKDDLGDKVLTVLGEDYSNRFSYPK